MNKIIIKLKNIYIKTIVKKDFVKLNIIVVFVSFLGLILNSMFNLGIPEELIAIILLLSSFHMVFLIKIYITIFNILEDEYKKSNNNKEEIKININSKELEIQNALSIIFDVDVNKIKEISMNIDLVKKNKNEILKEYKKRARILHPDMGGSTLEFQKLNNAKMVIEKL